MDIDLLKKHSFILAHNDVKYPKLNIEINDSYKKQDFQVKLYLLIEKYKNQIKNQKLWDFSKKLSNNFEMIHINSKNVNHNLGIANYDPISRSYFKMWEIIKDFHIIDFRKQNLKILGIAEGPGGFIEAIYNARKKYSSSYSDDCVCMTLRSYKNEIPGWKKSGRLFKENGTINVFYGTDGTGDLYKKHNLVALAELFQNEKADIVTADGGFDFSINYNEQESMVHRLIMSEIVGALSCLKKGGHFVLKIFDIFTNFTVKILYFLTIFFDNVNISKPFTSRPANSEKYLICKGFLGITEDYLMELFNIIEDWDILNEQRKCITDIFEMDVPIDFANCIKDYNLHVCSNQIKNILKTLSFMKLNLDNSNINKIKQNQAILSSLWCKKYDVPMNIRSKYLKNTEHYNYIPNFMNHN